MGAGVGQQVGQSQHCRRRHRLRGGGTGHRPARKTGLLGPLGGGCSHSTGNPHFQTSPINIAVVARNIATGLCKVDPGNCDAYRVRLTNFNDRLARRLYGEKLVELLGVDTLDPLTRSGRLVPFLEEKGFAGEIGGWLRDGMSFRGRKLVCYHKNWIYFTTLFGLDVAGYVETKPGIPPTARHVSELIERIEAEHIQVLLAANYFERSKPQLIADRTGIVPVVVPMSVDAGSGVATYFDLVDLWIGSLKTAYARTKPGHDLDDEFHGRALCPCLVLVGLHAYFGIHVIERRVLFVDLAVAQFAALGAVVGFAFGHHPGELGSTLYSLAFAVVAAALFALTRVQVEKIPQEAIIGITFVVASAATILVVAAGPRGGGAHQGDPLRIALVGDLADGRQGGGDLCGHRAFSLAAARAVPADISRSRPSLPPGLERALVGLPFYSSFGVMITFSVGIGGILMVFAYLGDTGLPLRSCCTPGCGRGWPWAGRLEGSARRWGSSGPIISTCRPDQRWWWFWV